MVLSTFLSAHTHAETGHNHLLSCAGFSVPHDCCVSEQHCSLVTCTSALKIREHQITFVNFTLQVVKAFVVLSPTFSSTDLQSLTRDLQDHVKKTTAPYKYPRKVNISEEKLYNKAPFPKSQQNYHLDFHYSLGRDSSKDLARLLTPEDLSQITLVFIIFTLFSCFTLFFIVVL